MTMMGFSAQSDAMRRLDEPARATSRTDREAEQFHAQAARALQQGQLGQAQTAMEQAVGLSPARCRLSSAARRHLSEAGPLRLGPRHLWRRARARSEQQPCGAQRRPDPDRAGQSARRRLQARRSRRPRAGGRCRPRLSRLPAVPIMPSRSSKRPPARRARPPAPARISRSLMPCRGDWRRARAVAAQDVSPDELPAQAAAMGRLRPSRRRRHAQSPPCSA